MLNGSRLMSRAFVKDADYLGELSERPVSEHPNDVTEAGLAQIEHALAAVSEAYATAQASANRATLAGSSDWSSRALPLGREGSKPAAFAYDHPGEEVGEGADPSAQMATKF
jgi:hypothetical protein